MIKEDVITTEVHFQGPYYRTKYAPHYVVHIEKICCDCTVLTWAYNSWGAVVRDRIKLEDLEPYKTNREVQK